jgi:phage-related minor tail protein
MNKIILATIACAFIAGSAFAGPSGSQSNGQTTKKTGNNAVTFIDYVFDQGQTTCNETQHPKFDTVSCALTTPNLALAGTSGTYGWNSDFNGTLGVITYPFSADGASYPGHVTY